MKDRILWLVFFLVLVSDQLTKHIARTSLELYERMEVIPGLFNFTLIFNPGAAFGLFAGLSDSYRHAAIGTVSVVALIVVFMMMKEAKGDKLSELALSGILAGAIGNLIDRFRFDAVVDFLDFYIGENHWPAFNIADSAISVGVALLVLRMLFPPKCAKTQQSEE